MRIERLELNNNKLKYIVIGVIITLLLVILINYLTSRANYRNTESIELAKGSINYSLVDLEIVSITIDDAPSDIMPGNGYVLKDTSYCTEKVGDTDTPSDTIELTYENGILNITPYTTKGTKCYLEFEKLPTAEDTLAKLFPNYTTAKSGTGFDGTDPSGVMKITGVDTANHENTLYAAPDNDGTSYFFRGQANNNWVQFANKRWRIIRINGDGTLRLIYQCGSTSCTNTAYTNTQLTALAYKTSPYNDNTYVGYYNLGKASSTYDEAHKGTTPSDIATYLNDWYGKNLATYDKYIDQDAGFCNDRQKVIGVNSSYDSGTGFGTSATSYAMWGRVVKSGSTRKTQYPTLKCGVSAATATDQETSVDVNAAAYERDLFTKNGASKGNKLLQYPIGLITADEVLLAGGFWDSANSSYYLYTNQYYWTMSPHIFYTSGYARVFYVTPGGGLGSDGVYFTEPGVRPVINLKATTKFSGKGTVGDPYIPS